MVNPEIYWPPDLGEVLAWGEIDEDGIRLFEASDQLLARRGTEIIFGVESRPPLYSTGLFVRVVNAEIAEAARCFIPWRAIGDWALGCGIRIIARATDMGWMLSFRGESPRGKMLHVCWNRPPG